MPRPRTLSELQAAVAALRLAARIARLLRAWRPRRLRRMLRRGLVPALALALLATPLGAQAPPIPFPRPFTAELQVDDAGNDGTPAVAMAADGRFAVAWTDRSGNDVLVATYDSAGGRDAGPIVANPTTGAYTSSFARPDIAMDADGDFVVVWSGFTTSGELSFDAILAQRFDSDGALLGDAIIVDAIGSGSLSTPSVAIDDAGSFAVGWVRDEPSAPDTARVRRYTVDGAAIPGLDAPLDTGFFDGLSLGMDADGDFAAAWSESDDVYAARFDASDNALRPVAGGQPLHPVRSGSFFNEHPAVAMDAEGDFAVVWDTFENGPRRIIARRFDQDGLADGGEIVVAPTESSLDGPRAAMLDAGALAVVWGAVAGDDNVVRLAFLRPGSLAPDQTEVVNPIFDNGELTPDLAARPVGSLAVAWQADAVPPGSEFPDENIYARLYRSPVTYSVSTSTAGTTEGGGQPVTLTVFRDGVVAGRSTVDYRFAGTALPGRDYTVAGDADAAEGTLVFAAGERSKQLVLRIIDDQLGEPNKSILLELSNPQPTGAGRITFPVAVVTLGDDDLSEVRIAQTDGSTVVSTTAADELRVALRTVPSARVTVRLTPTSLQLDLGAGLGVPLALTFEPDASAKEPQTVRVSAAGGAERAGLAAAAGIALSAESADPGYSAGARFTVDGHDLGTIAVNLAGDVPPIYGIYLPLLRR